MTGIQKVGIRNVGRHKLGINYLILQRSAAGTLPYSDGFGAYFGAFRGIRGVMYIVPKN
jgi:hypothetical protein